jgi:hypothetical protein
MSRDVVSLSREALLDADLGVQKAWLEAVEPDYQMRAYDDLDFGLFYPHSSDWLEDLRDTHGDDFAEFLEGVGRPISKHCIQRILFGGLVEATEAQAIMDFVAEGDPEGCWSLVGWGSRCQDAPVFVVCIGRSEGQGGLVLELFGVFPDRAAAVAACSALQVVGARQDVVPPVSLRAFWGNGDADSSLAVSGAKWARIQSGQPHIDRSVSYFEGEPLVVYWRFQDGRVTIEDDEGTGRVVDLPVSELLVTAVSPSSPT